MFKGEINLSRARGTKTQQKKQQFYPYQEPANTIDFQQAVKYKNKRIELVPKTQAQENLIIHLLDPSTNIVVTTGPAGTGKSYLAMMAALQALRSQQCERVILTRPAVAVEEERHGFLPGDINRKMEPWTRPLLDIMKEFYHPRDVVRMIEEEVIEISPLAFMRGRTFKNAWIVADEMQNATPNQVKMLLTRIGVNSKIVVTGDVEQTDRSRSQNGLMDLCARIDRHSPGAIKHCELGLRDVQRHPIIDSIIRMYD